MTGTTFIQMPFPFVIPLRPCTVASLLPTQYSVWSSLLWSSCSWIIQLYQVKMRMDISVNGAIQGPRASARKSRSRVKVLPPDRPPSQGPRRWRCSLTFEAASRGGLSKINVQCSAEAKDPWRVSYRGTKRSASYGVLAPVSFSVSFLRDIDSDGDCFLFLNARLIRVHCSFPTWLSRGMLPVSLPKIPTNQSACKQPHTALGKAGHVLYPQDPSAMTPGGEITT
jgi:hypothetical protein